MSHSQIGGASGRSPQVLTLRTTSTPASKVRDATEVKGSQIGSIDALRMSLCLNNLTEGEI